MRYVIVAVTRCALSSLSARASEWSAWSSIGDDVSLSYTQLTKETWTWRFRNDGSTAITFMTFTYTDADGEHPGVLPGSLEPGMVDPGSDSSKETSGLWRPPAVKVISI
jgi:hypothetical protein